MATIVPQSELVKRAIQWIAEGKEDGSKTMKKLVDEAALRFNLGPKDVEFLDKFFRDHPDKFC